MDDYTVSQKSDEYLKARAEIALSNNNFALDYFVDVCSIQYIKQINTDFGLKRLTFEIISDDEMPGDDGLTTYARDTVSIAIKKTIWLKATSGEARARMTIAHEIGHAILHRDLILRRGTIEPVRPKHIEPSRSAERQAKVFAARFLMPSILISNCHTVAEIARRCLVSQESAEIRYREINAALRRRALASKMRLLSEQLKVVDVQGVKKPEYISKPCPICGEIKIQAIGCKYMCMNCDNVSDMFQDGD